MFLLRFTFQNHRSFRDETDLTLVQPGLRTKVPREGTWADHTNRIAAIYGANASGKSGVLEALDFMRNMIRYSASAWSGRKRLPRIPFALDEDSRRRPSTFALDFVMGDVRYEYGFSMTESQISEEWLYTFPTGRKRVLFERGEGVGTITAGRELKGGDSTLNKVTGQRELVLSKGASLKNEQLEDIYNALTQHLALARFNESDRQGRLRSVIADVADGTLSFDDLHIMLKVADVGIAGAELTEQEAPPQVRKLLRSLFRVGASIQQDHSSAGKEDGEVRDSPGLIPEAEKEDDEPVFALMDDEEFEKFMAETEKSLKFRHVGANEEVYQLSTSDQSTGTLSWLSLAAPALRMIRIGGVFVVDELDASLHPHLSQVMIQMFRDDRLNTKGAQLIFTTHDTYFMSASSPCQLRPDEVWLAEKSRDGASELFSLADFPTRSGDNLSRRYLQGRYGAVPAVAPSFLAGLSASPDHAHEASKRERLDDGLPLA